MERRGSEVRHSVARWVPPAAQRQTSRDNAQPHRLDTSQPELQRRVPHGSVGMGGACDVNALRVPGSCGLPEQGSQFWLSVARHQPLRSQCLHHRRDSAGRSADLSGGLPNGDACRPIHKDLDRDSEPDRPCERSRSSLRPRLSCCLGVDEEPGDEQVAEQLTCASRSAVWACAVTMSRRTSNIVSSGGRLVVLGTQQWCKGKVYERVLLEIEAESRPLTSSNRSGPRFPGAAQWVGVTWP